MTIGVSLFFLLASTLVVGIVWSEQKTGWIEATRSRTYNHPKVYVMRLGVVQFPPGSTDQQIKEELDRSATAAIEKAVTRSAMLRSLRFSNPDYAPFTDAELATRLIDHDPSAWSALEDIVIGDGARVTFLPATTPSLFHLAPGDDISHLYVAASPGHSSMLYTRGLAMKAVASSERRVAAVYEDLATFYDSPRARPAPFSLLPVLVFVALVSVALPWGIFFFGRWVARSFAAPAGLDNAVKRGHMCTRCQSRAIVRVERGDVFERMLLRYRGKLPYRCLDCDHRFLDRPISRRPVVANDLTGGR